MDFIYVFIYGSEWEDIIIYLSKEDAIKKSLNHPNCRVEIFSKTNTLEDQSSYESLGDSKSTNAFPLGYEPTYNYYQNGEFIHNSMSTSSPKPDLILD
jgi:hypothetical protein